MYDHRYDGDTHLHGHMKAALLERCELARRCPGAFRCNDQGLSLVLHGRHQGCHGFNGLAAVRPVNKHNTGCPHGLADEWHALDLFFAHRDDVPTNQASHDSHISFALMVEHENCGALAPQVFFAPDIQIETDQGACGVREQ